MTSIDFETASVAAAAWTVNPFLHYEESRVYNPLTDRALPLDNPGYVRFRDFVDHGVVDEALVRDGWIVRAGEDLSHRSLLKVVSIETMTACNQKCYFCPVSIAPREDENMPRELYERIVAQLREYRLDGVFLQSYNEPTIDKRFVDNCRTLFEAGLPVAVLSNGSGLTPGKVDELLRLGTMRYLCINLSTLDRDKYKADRGADHLGVVLRNLDYLRNLKLAEQMRIVVLGGMDDVHRSDFEAIRERFAGSLFEVAMHRATDRAGWLSTGHHVERKKKLAGCDLIGSRPIQHLHITPAGKCILCCQDYDEVHIVGDLAMSSVREVLAGEEMAKMRRWVYGIEEAPEDFMCRTCEFALTR